MVTPRIPSQLKSAAEAASFVPKLAPCLPVISSSELSEEFQDLRRQYEGAVGSLHHGDSDSIEEAIRSDLSRESGSEYFEISLHGRYAEFRTSFDRARAFKRLWRTPEGLHYCNVLVIEEYG